MIDAGQSVRSLLERFGPDAAGAGVSPEAARAYVRDLALGHYENFSVLSRLAPAELRDDFAAVYAFCRWSDDLGDEMGSDEAARAEALRLLEWWRGELRACFENGEAAHPVFVALRETIGRHGPPMKPFADLIDAFAQDQRVTRYRTWDQVLDYCTRSANPVGRIVLHLAGVPERPEHADLYAMSDATCTALQLANFWQDVRRDLVERDRVYIPSEDTGVTAEMLKDWMNRGDDPAARVPYIHAVRGLIEKTWPLFVRGRNLPGRLRGGPGRGVAPVIWLFGAGGETLLRRVERIGCATLWRRPRVSAGDKAFLVGRAWAMSRIGMF